MDILLKHLEIPQFPQVHRERENTTPDPSLDAAHAKCLAVQHAKQEQINSEGPHSITLVRTAGYLWFSCRYCRYFRLTELLVLVTH